jgi:hypothetical protein
MLLKNSPSTSVKGVGIIKPMFALISKPIPVPTARDRALSNSLVVVATRQKSRAY